MASRSRSTPKIRPRHSRCHQRQCRAISSQARAALKTMQYNNFCLTLNSRARAARACFLRQPSQKMRSSFEQTGLRADKPRPRRSIPSAVLPRGKATYPRKTGAQNHAQAARARHTKAVRFGSRTLFGKPSTVGISVQIRRNSHYRDRRKPKVGGPAPQLFGNGLWAMKDHTDAARCASTSPLSRLWGGFLSPMP